MPKLTDTQLVILSTAAQRGDGAVLPLPKSLKIKGGAVAAVLKSLVKRGLIEERPAGRDDEAWREADGQRLTLVVASAGLEAIGIEPDQQPDQSDAGAKAKPRRGKTTPANGSASSAGSPAVRPGTKQALLIDLLKREDGATLAEIGEATGWQPHSVRGAISGTLRKKLGLAVSSDKVEGRGRVYRIVGHG